MDAMPELRDLIALLYTARESFNTVHVRWRYTVDPDAMNSLMQRLADQQPPGSTATLTATSQTQHTETTSRFDLRLWWRKPGCWRDENQGSGYILGTILCDGRAFSFDPHTQRWQPSTSNVVLEDRLDDVPLLDPSFLLTSHDLRPLAETVHTGREAVQVQAIYRKGKSRIYEPVFWTTADEYALLVDKERGVLLRYAAKLNGQEVAVAAVDHIEFDEPVADAVFSPDES